MSICSFRDQASREGGQRACLEGVHRSIIRLSSQILQKLKGCFHEGFPFDKAKKAGLSSPENYIEVVAVNPRQVSIYATVRADIACPKTFQPSSFKDSKSSFSSREYRHQSLARFSAKSETSRREKNIEYGQAV